MQRPFKLQALNWKIIICVSTFIYYFFSKLLFSFYGYISTEEGTMLINQHYAYTGKLPFIQYDAWNSLLNDYLIGWFQYIFNATILNQRLVGLLLNVLTLIFTLKLARRIGGRYITTFTLILITFGSYIYAYLGTIPYSEQTMTFFLILAFYFISTIQSKKIFPRASLAAFFAIVSAVNRIQAVPIVIILLIYLFIFVTKQKRERIALGIISLLTLCLLLLPFLAANPKKTLYAMAWPLFADKILIYQLGASASLVGFFSFIQELLRDYGVFVLIIGSGLVWWLKKYQKKKNETHIIVFFLLLIGSFLVTGLVHKPPYASYLYPAVPFMAIVGAFFVDRMITNIALASFVYPLLGLLLFYNVVLFPHFKFLSLSRTNKHTPHARLTSIAQIVQTHSEKNDEILSFYTPITQTAQRKIPQYFNRDRFSLSILPNETAQEFNLTTPSLLITYINARSARLILFTDNMYRFFGASEMERANVLKAIQQNYQLLFTDEQMKYIEGPTIKNLYIYARK